MKKKILITGVNGMLGSVIYKDLTTFPDNQVIGIGRSSSIYPKNTYIQGNLTDNSFLNDIFSSSRYDIIIHCAAIVNLNFCQENKKEANKIHIEATRQLAKLNPKAIFFYISTDSVFKGEIGNYLEEDKVDPLNHYALSKYLGERAIVENHPSHYIFRTNMYGFRPANKNSLFEWGYNSLINEKQISGYSNVIFNPLYIGQISKIIIQFINQKPTFGIYNLGSNKVLSKYSFLKKLATEFGLNPNLVIPTIFDDSTSKLKRPKNTSLNITKLKSIIPNDLLNLDEGFDEIKKIVSLK